MRPGPTSHSRILATVRRGVVSLRHLRHVPPTRQYCDCCLQNRVS